VENIIVDERRMVAVALLRVALFDSRTDEVGDFLNKCSKVRL
jgi:hypothetical protein